MDGPESSDSRRLAPRDLEDLGHLAAHAPSVAVNGFRYQERPGPKAARTWLACTWSAQVATAAGHRQRVLPDACIEIVVRSDQCALVYGPTARWRDLDLAAGFACEGIRLRPGASRVLGVDASELIDQVVPLHALNLAHGPRRHPAGVTVEALVTQINQCDHRQPDPIAHQAVDLLHRFPGIGVARVATIIGMSERQLRRRVNRAIGVPLTSYRRIARVNEALAAAARLPRRSWASLAIEMGLPTSPTSRGKSSR